MSSKAQYVGLDVKMQIESGKLSDKIKKYFGSHLPFFTLVSSS